MFERFKSDIGIYDVKSKKIVHRSVNQRNICLYNHKNLFCFYWKKRDSLLNGVQEIGRNFEYALNETNEKNLSQRIRDRFPKHKIVDQLENVFIFDIEAFAV